MTIRFPNTGDDFSGLHAAEEWCKARGISVGRLQGPSPIGLLKGDFDIQKWRNLNAKDRAALHGTITFLGPPHCSDAVVTFDEKWLEVPA